MLDPVVHWRRLGGKRMSTEVRILESHEAAVLDHVARGVFDNDVDAQLTAEFFADPRHHLAVAIEDGVVVGMASGVHYVHPDKPAQLFINEVGVAPSHQRQGIGRRVLEVLLKRGRELGCPQAWVLTSRTNTAATRLYASLGGQDASEELQVMFEFQ